MSDRNGISIDKSDTGRPSRSKKVNHWVRLGAAVIILVVLVAFILDNSGHVRVGYVFGHANPRLIWVLLITAALGALASRLVPRLRARRARGGRGGERSEPPAKG
jgi:uncharacterized integral membrane protein